MLLADLVIDTFGGDGGLVGVVRNILDIVCLK
jgi:hypothetical protein